MIQRITSRDEFSQLPDKGIEAGKIRALLAAYGSDYDFCRFFRQGSTYVSALDGAYVISASGDADVDELAQFFCMSGFAEIFCSATIGMSLAEKLSADHALINSMSFTGSVLPSAEYNSAPSLSDVYSVISEGFDIPFEPWYLDISHRVRHGVSVCCTLDEKAALVIQHNINGEALISQVACRKAYRGQGIAAGLVASVAAALAPSEVFVLCEDELIPFYEKCGFILAGNYSVISRRN